MTAPITSNHTSHNANPSEHCSQPEKRLAVSPEYTPLQRRLRPSTYPIMQILISEPPKPLQLSHTGRLKSHHYDPRHETRPCPEAHAEKQPFSAWEQNRVARQYVAVTMHTQNIQNAKREKREVDV